MVCRVGREAETDYPYPWTSTSVEHVLGSPHLSDAQRAAILGATAATLQPHAGARVVRPEAANPSGPARLGLMTALLGCRQLSL